MVLSWHRLTLACSCLLTGILAGGGGKYSKEFNENRMNPGETGEFRIVKLNQVWEKAQRLHLSAVKVAELHSDLKMQEKDELNWKKLKAEGFDEDGEKEAKLRRNLNVIMAKYGLDGKKETQVGDDNYIKGGTENDVLDDPRLDKLWNKAKTSGKFSDEDLEKLWREFTHHKEKTHEYNILLDTVSRTEEIHKNVISPSEYEVKEEVLHGKHSELKDKLRSINRGFERIRKLSHEGYESDNDFEEPRVNDLWDMAKIANFTPAELESFKEELKHFEAKVEKHQHYQKQLEISHEKLKHVEKTGDKEHLSRNKEKYSMLAEKTKELGYKYRAYFGNGSCMTRMGPVMKKRALYTHWPMEQRPRERVIPATTPLLAQVVSDIICPYFRNSQDVVSFTNAAFCTPSSKVHYSFNVPKGQYYGLKILEE